MDAPIAYRTLPAEVDAPALREALHAGAFSALTFASPSAVRHFTALLDPAALAAARRNAVAAIGPVTAQALGRAGLPPDVIAPEASPRALVRALAEHVAAATADR